MPWRACRARMMFSRIERCGMMPSILRFSGVKAKPALMVSRGELKWTGLPSGRTPRSPLYRCQRSAGPFRCARAKQAGQAENFSFGDLHIHGRDGAGAAKLFQLEERFFASALLPAFRL